MSRMRKIPPRFGQDRWLLGHPDGGKIGDSIIVSRTQLEDIVREGAKELGLIISEKPPGGTPKWMP